jgi:hypothetical protein
VKLSPVGIYRPPNLRRTYNETVSADENPENSYVPPKTALNTTTPSSAIAASDSKTAITDDFNKIIDFNDHHLQNFKHSSPHRISKTTDPHRESLNEVTNVGKPSTTSPSTSPESNDDDSQLLKQNRTRERRPDRAVYVPRARRSQTVTGAVTIPSETVTPHDVKIKDLTNAKIKKLSSNLTKSEKLLENHNKHKSSDDNASDIDALQKDVLSVNTTSITANFSTVINNLSYDKFSNLNDSNKIISKRVSVDSLDKILVNSSCNDNSGFQRADNSNSLQNIINLQQQQQQQTDCDWTPNSEQQLAQKTNEKECKRDKLEDNVKLLLNKIDSTNTNSSSSTTPTSTSTNSPEIQQPDQQLLFNKNSPTTAPSIMDLMSTQQNGIVTAPPLTINRNGHDINEKKEDRDEKILRRQSQEMNRSNRRLIKQTFNSDILEICDEQQNDKEKTSQKPRRKSKKPTKLSTDDTHRMSPEEDDWETMFDDNGDCLDPKLMDELTLAVGKVTIVRPQNNYKVSVTHTIKLTDILYYNTQSDFLIGKEIKKIIPIPGIEPGPTG